MAIVKFPEVEEAQEGGLLALGGDLEVPSLLLAYSQGIYPWPSDDRSPIPWFSPDPRGVLDYKDLKISQSLKKFLKKSPYEIKINTDFHGTILNCASSPHRREGSGTWITRKMIEAYIDLFYAGHAFSVEAYEEGELVGGLYGVTIGKMVCGESMFYTRPNASKAALIYLLHFLHEQEVEWIDTQMVTPVVQSLGGKEIPRKEFLKRLKKALSVPASTTVFPRPFE